MTQQEDNGTVPIMKIIRDRRNIFRMIKIF